MPLKNIIIISYYFPPCAKPGIHRVHSMAEYLPRFGWQPIFIASENGYYGRLQRLDNSLLDMMKKHPIYRVPFFYPFNNQDSRLFARGARRLWETFLIPDGKVLWVNKIKKMIRKIVIKHKPDVFFITATPFSPFLLAPFLRKEFDVPIVLGYRDPWAENLYIEHIRLKSKVNRFYEKRSLAVADMVTTTSFHMIDYIKKCLGSMTDTKQFFGFPFGYDSDFFSKNILKVRKSHQSGKIVATFAGAVHPGIDVRLILEGIRTAINSDKNTDEKLRINCFGTLFGCSRDAEDLIKGYGLEKYVYLHPFLPYIDFLNELRKSSFLLLPHGECPLTSVLYPAKLFDYLGVARPILYIGRQGQAAETILNCKAGLCASTDSKSISEAFITLVQQEGKESWYSSSLEYEKFDRYNIFKRFCNKLNEIC